jgi:hypothetical protein
VLYVTVKLQWEDWPKGWSFAQKEAFVAKCHQVLLEAWSGKHRISLVGGSPSVCKCPCGTRVEFVFENWIGQVTTKEHWEVQVEEHAPNTAPRGYTGSGNIEVDTLAAERSPTQNMPHLKKTPIVHEFGHTILGDKADEYLEGLPMLPIGKDNAAILGHVLMKNEENSVMAYGDVVYPRHYRPFVDWMNKNLGSGGCKYGIPEK